MQQQRRRQPQQRAQPQQRQQGCEPAPSSRPTRAHPCRWRRTPGGPAPTAAGRRRSRRPRRPRPSARAAPAVRGPRRGREPAGRRVGCDCAAAVGTAPAARKRRAASRHHRSQRKQQPPATRVPWQSRALPARAWSPPAPPCAASPPPPPAEDERREARTPGGCRRSEAVAAALGCTQAVLHHSQPASPSVRFPPARRRSAQAQHPPGSPRACRRSRPGRRASLPPRWPAPPRQYSPCSCPTARHQGRKCCPAPAARRS